MKEKNWFLQRYNQDVSNLRGILLIMFSLFVGMCIGYIRWGLY